MRRYRAVVRRSLFPDPPAPSVSAARRHLGQVAALLTAVAAVPVAAARLPPGAWNSLWAEDGSRFLQQSLDLSPWQAFTIPYAGYLHALPRLSSEVVTLLPLEYAGVAFTLIAAAVVVWVAWTAWQSAAGHLTSPWLRFGLAAAVVVVPAGGLEAAGSVANSHFYLVFGAFWALLGRPRSWAAIGSAHAMVLLAALSDPISLGLLPLALLRLCCLSGWRDRAVAVSFLAALAAQVVVVLGSQRPQGPDPTLATLVFGYDFRVVSPSFLGISGTQELVADAGPGVFKYVGAAVLLALVAGLLAARAHRLAIVLGVVASVAFFAVTGISALRGGFPPTAENRLVLVAASRYSIVPSLLLLTSWLLVAQALQDRLRSGLRHVVLMAAAPVLVWGLTDFRADRPLRSAGIDWSTTVEQARDACDAAAGTGAFLADIEPGLPWQVRIDCAGLR